MEKCRTFIQIFSEDIRMEFGLNKCAVIHVKHGKVENSACVKAIPLLSIEDSYKYLGIAQNDMILHTKMKEKTRKEYLQRVRAILRSEINAKNTINAIKTYVIPILRYGFGILKWTQGELRAMDTKTRKTLTKHGFHHPKSNKHRLYMPRNNGGRGLLGAMDCHQQECATLATYLTETRDKDRLVKVVEQTKNQKVHGIMSYHEGEKNKNANEINENHQKNLLTMKLHGEYFN